MGYLSPSLYLLVLAVPVAHVLVAPYTKVEESFTLHAARDVLHHGFFTKHALEQYDHRTFPGAVPRSFIPSVIWATLSLPLLRMGQTTGWANKGIDEQIVLRIVLAILNGLSIIHVAKALSRRNRSRSTSIFYLVLSLSQFHTMFYAGRPLPNFTALPLVNLAVSYLVEGLTTRMESPGGRFNRVSRAVTILALTTSIIRSELALFLGALSLYLLITRKISLLHLMTSGLIGGGGGAVLSTVVDSFFWGRWTWPEFEALVFNVVQGKSEEWGVSPWYSYLLVNLPKITLFSLPLAVYALTTGAAGRGLSGMMATCIVGLVGGLSCLAHKVGQVWDKRDSCVIVDLSSICGRSDRMKEWRFIVYVVPLVNILAATGAAQVWDRATKRKSMMDKLGGLVLLGGLLLNLVVTIGLTFVSVHNYPGGEAIEALRRVGASSGRSELRVFLPPSVLQTGASRYTFEQDDNSLPRWEFNRTESESLQTPAQIWSAGFDYTITDEIERFLQDGRSEWYMVEAIESFGGVSLKPTPGPVWSPRLWILSRETLAVDV